MKIKLSVKECAEFMNKSQPDIRKGLRNKRFPFGSAVQTKEPTPENPEGNWDYHIPLIPVEQYMGISYEEWLKIKRVWLSYETQKS